MILARFSRDYFIPNFCDGDVVGTYSRIAMKEDEGKWSFTGTRAWQWMTCNEVGYWQISPGRVGIRPKNLTQQWFAQQCEDIFGREHRWPNVTVFNQKYHGLQQNATKVFYVTSAQDPWTWTCVTEDSGVPLGSRAHTVMGNEMGHCSDLHGAQAPDPPDLTKTRELERAVILQWMNEDP
jgi:hypothetical protein